MFWVARFLTSKTFRKDNTEPMLTQLAIAVSGDVSQYLNSFRLERRAYPLLDPLSKPQ